MLTTVQYVELCDSRSVLSKKRNGDPISVIPWRGFQAWRHVRGPSLRGEIYTCIYIYYNEMERGESFDSGTVSDKSDLFKNELRIVGSRMGCPQLQP